MLTNFLVTSTVIKKCTSPLTDIVPYQVLPQYEYVDMITNTLPTTELEMNTCTTYGVIKYCIHSNCLYYMSYSNSSNKH